MIVVWNVSLARGLFPAFGNTLAATRTATKVKAGLLFKWPVMAAYYDDLGCMVEVINLRIIKGATVNFLKFTDYGFGIIGFWFCHVGFLFDNASNHGGVSVCAKQICRTIRILYFWPIRLKPALRFAWRGQHYCLILHISQYLDRRIGRTVSIILRCLLALVEFI